MWHRPSGGRRGRESGASPRRRPAGSRGHRSRAGAGPGRWRRRHPRRRRCTRPGPLRPAARRRRSRRRRRAGATPPPTVPAGPRHLPSTPPSAPPPRPGSGRARLWPGPAPSSRCPPHHPGAKAVPRRRWRCRRWRRPRRAAHPVRPGPPSRDPRGGGRPGRRAGQPGAAGRRTQEGDRVVAHGAPPARWSTAWRAPRPRLGPSGPPPAGSSPSGRDSRILGAPRLRVRDYAEGWDRKRRWYADPSYVEGRSPLSTSQFDGLDAGKVHEV
jgi:hypothetical protein